MAAVTLTFGITSAFAQPKPAAAPATAPKPAAGAPVGKAPQSVILFLDRGTILRQSAVGKNIAAQVEALGKKMEVEFAPEQKKLQADVQALQSQAAVLSTEVRAQKVKDIETRRQALQKKVRDRQAAVQQGLANARTQVEKALGPILEKIMIEKSANLLLDRGLVVLGDSKLDVTKTVIQRLDTALPKLTVTPVAPKAVAKPAAAKPNG
jgi:Skp family chaperone for outer membrane proteins